MSDKVKTYQDLLNEIESLKLENAELKSGDYADRYRQSFEKHLAVKLIIDPLDGKIHDANYAAADYYGWSREELRTMTIQQINMSSAETISNEMNKAKEHKKYQFEFKHKLANGSIRDVYVLSVGISGLSGKVYLHSIVFDITDRKQAEISLQRQQHVLELFVEHSPAAIAMLDKEMKYIAVSKRYLLDYQLGNQKVIGSSHYDVFPEIPDSWKEIHQRCLGGAVEKNDEDPFPRSSGEIDWVRWEIHPWYEIEGEVGGIILFSEVITERKQGEEKLKVALKEKEVLLRELYHRTKNNMQVIYSLLGLKGAAVEDDATKEILVDIGSRIQAIALVHEKLYQSKNLSRIDLKEYITDLTNLLLNSFNFSERKIRLFLDLESISVLIDTAIPCGQIIIELISNSFKHAFPDGRSGKISIHLSRNEKDLIKLNISDNGIGIKDFTEMIGGETLGMQLFRNIVEDQLQGNISYDMKNGVSWTVTFKDALYDERVISQ